MYELAVDGGDIKPVIKRIKRKDVVKEEKG